MSAMYSKCGLCGRQLPLRGYTVLVKRVSPHRKTRRKVHRECLTRAEAQRKEGK
jgi:adenylylsulfate kinase-like enzyme